MPKLWRHNGVPMADSTTPISEQPTSQRSIAAAVDSGLAGLLSSVLAHHREEPQAHLASDDLESLFDFADDADHSAPDLVPEIAAESHDFANNPNLGFEEVVEAAPHEVASTEAAPESEPFGTTQPEFTAPLDGEVPALHDSTTLASAQPVDDPSLVLLEAIAKPARRKKGRLGPSGPAETVVESEAGFGHFQSDNETGGEPISEAGSVFSDITPQVAAEAAQAFEPQPTFEPQPAFEPQPVFEPQQAHETVEPFVISQDGPRYENNPVYDPGIQVPRPAPAPVVQEAPPAPKRLLTSLQIGLLLEGLSQLRARPGEDGLPPGMLLMDVRGPLGRYHNDSLYSIRAQIDAAVRGGDMALVAPDIGIVLFCGGLFFPGDLEVMGARLRRRALDANPSVSAADELKIVVAGALSAPGEDPAEFILRGVNTFDRSIDSSRQDIAVDYADGRTYRF
jgi:hypothetical protein